MRYLILGLLALSLAMVGCTIFGQEENVTNETEPPPPPPPPPKPVLVTVLSPTSGEVIMSQEDTTDVTLALSTQNLILRSPGGAAKSGEGHFLITLDEGESQTLTTKTFVLSGVAVGDHTIKIELQNNDKTPYSPSLTKTVSFTVEKEKPKEYVPVEHKVVITDSGFSPSSVTAKVGDSVTWENQGKMPQTATCFIGGSKVFDTGTIASGKSATIKMGQMLECDYYSQLFRALTGTIKVESNGTETQ